LFFSIFHNEYQWISCKLRLTRPQAKTTHTFSRPIDTSIPNSSSGIRSNEFYRSRWPTNYLYPSSQTMPYFDPYSLTPFWHGPSTGRYGVRSLGLWTSQPQLRPRWIIGASDGVRSIGNRRCKNLSGTIYNFIYCRSNIIIHLGLNWGWLVHRPRLRTHLAGLLIPLFLTPHQV
jgi:hypothetical protein